MEIPCQNAQMEGTTLPNVHILSLSCRTGSRPFDGLRSGKETAQDTIAIEATIYGSLWAHRARNPQKILKRVFLGVCNKVPENTRKSRRIPEKSKFGFFFQVFLDFFGYFRGLLCRPPKRLFSRFFGDFGPRGPRDSCKWSLE